MKVKIELNYHLLAKTKKMATKPSARAILSIICGVWFLLTSWFWTFLINMIISFPVGIVGIVLWYYARKSDPSSKLAKASLYLHVAGLASSILTLLALIVFN